MPLIAAALLSLTALMLELCWLGAWATFVWSGLFERPYPLPHTLACAGFAALLVRLSAQRGLRNIQVLALHGAGMIGMWLYALQHLQGQSTLLAFVLAVCTAAFWCSGALHARRTLTHQQVCSRFDFGMYWLLGLLGLRLLLRAQPQVPTPAEWSDALVPIYFVNALCAISISRFRSQTSKQWLRVSGRIAGWFAVLCGLSVLCFSITWLCRPYLRMLAETSHTGAALVARPIANGFAELVLYIMREGRKHPLQFLPIRLPVPESKHRSVEHAPVESLATGLLDPSTLWIIAAAVALVGVLLWAWWKRHWLWADQAQSAEYNDLWAWWLRLWRSALAWLRRPRVPLDPEPVRLLRALMVWGRRSGLAHERAETPREYAARLKQRFAAMSGEIDAIVSSHGQHTYALCRGDERELQQARRALARLRSPRQWWIRSSTWWRARVSSPVGFDLPKDPAALLVKGDQALASVTTVFQHRDERTRAEALKQRQEAAKDLNV